VRIGGLEKRLEITSDRVWEDDQASPPTPFTEMPLTWEAAFGGEGFENNPLGKGAAEIEGPDGSLRPLPNIERPNDRVQSPQDLPEPASFGPVDFSWPQRRSKAGTYDKAWLDEQFPGHALDMDWTIFNAAPDDQQLAGPSFLGDEEFTLSGMHPSKATLTGSLPRLIARCLVDCEADGQAVFQDVRLGLTTVWFFPAAERYLLVFHGALPVGEDDAADVRYLMVAGEDLGSPRAMEHYDSVFADRTHPEDGPIHGLDDAPLLPERAALLAGGGSAAEADTALLERQNFSQTYQQERGDRKRAEARAMLEADGLDPDLYCPLPEPVPPPPEDIGEALAQAKAQKVAGEARAAEAKAAAAQEREATRAQLEAAGLDPAAVLCDPEALPVGPPAFTAAAAAADLAAGLTDAKRQGIDIPVLQAMLDDPSVQQQWRDAEQFARDSYRRIAHEQGPAPRLKGPAASEARAAFEALLAGESPLVRLNLTGADLSGLDLSGKDLSECWLESANLAGTNLAGANLEGAVLVRSDLTGTNLSDTNLRGANLSLALCKDTVADGADLSEAILVKTQFEDASFRGSDLTGALVMDLENPRVDFSEAKLEKITLRQMDLRGFRLAGAKLDGCQLLEVDISGVDLSAASIDGVAIVETKADGANFAGASICGSCFVMGSSAAGAQFTSAVIETTSLRGTPLQQADFSDAKLKGSDLSECDLSEAKMVRTTAPGALFIRTNFTDANLQHADFMGAILQKADLKGAKLDGVNLYTADLALVNISPATSFEGANQEKARKVPELQPLPPVPSNLPWMS
jgi:uncharacterized protein YjbI with pentapeptide repeats